MEAQELINSLKGQLKANLSQKDYQKVCSILGNIGLAYDSFAAKEQFEIAKKAVSEMQRCYSKLLKILPRKKLTELRKFISSCQSEANSFGHEAHEALQERLEETGANIFGIPAYMYSGDSDDYDDYWVNRRMAEFY